MTSTDIEFRLATLEADVAVLRERLEHAEAVAGIKRGLDELNRGLGRPAKEVVKRLRAKHHLSST